MSRQKLLNRAKEISFLVLETEKDLLEQGLGAEVLAQALLAQSSVMCKILGSVK